MNTYTMDQIEEGKTRADFQVLVSVGMVDAFERMSGDHNPMHTDGKYAQSQGMKDKVAYGMLVSSLGDQG